MLDADKEKIAALEKIANDFKNAADAFKELSKSFLRVHQSYRYVVGTVGDVAVSTSTPVRFPSDAGGQTGNVMAFIKRGGVKMIRIHNTGSISPVYVAFNRDADTTEPLIVPANSIHEFEMELDSYVSLISSGNTTVRVSFWGE